jgi:hypothetical protein
MILFSLILGIIEIGRFMFIFTQITAAAQEGARFGSENPIQVIQAIDDGGNDYAAVLHANNGCNIVDKAWERLVLVPKGGHWDDPPGGANDGVDITVEFDNGTPGGTCACAATFDNPPVIFNSGDDRVLVTATYKFHFLTGILDRFVPATGLPISVKSARTILRGQQTQPASPQCETPP